MLLLCGNGLIYFYTKYPAYSKSQFIFCHLNISVWFIGILGFIGLLVDGCIRV